MGMDIYWYSQAVSDLKLLDWTIREVLIIKTVNLLLGDNGDEVIEQGPGGCNFCRVKPIPGYWVLYTAYPDRKEITAVIECMREVTKGSKHATVRIAQIRNETEVEFKKVESLLEGWR